MFSYRNSEVNTVFVLGLIYKCYVICDVHIMCICNEKNKGSTTFAMFYNLKRGEALGTKYFFIGAGAYRKAGFKGQG